MTAVKIYLCFLLTYVGIAAGRLPWLRVDRTGIALVGLIALLGTEALTLDEIGARIDMPTLLLIFALMIISAQFVVSGLCDSVFSRIEHFGRSPLQILALTITASGALSAFLANDILVFVAAPAIFDLARERGLNPRPYLIALIVAANAGSAATIIGAPQTILIGQLGNLKFPTYLLAGGIPAIAALFIVFFVIAFVWRGRLVADPADATEISPPRNVPREHDRHQTNKAFVALACLLALFSTDLPKDVFSLPIAAFLLLNRKYASRQMIGMVDWPMLLLIACLSGVTGALGSTALPGLLIDYLSNVGFLPNNLMLMTPLTLLMSSTIGNVPGSILFLQLWQDAPSGTLYGLAVLSTLAGNLMLVAGVSNIIVVERAAEWGIILHHREFARIGVPVTILSIAFAVFWLYITGFMPFLPTPAAAG